LDRVGDSAAFDDLRRDCEFARAAGLAGNVGRFREVDAFSTIGEFMAKRVGKRSEGRGTRDEGRAASGSSAGPSPRPSPLAPRPTRNLGWVGRAAPSAEFPHAAARGYGYRWQKYSRAFLARHPLCVRCRQAGRATPSECTDHIVPVTGPDDPGFWKPTNHQALCWRCHSVKTMTEDRLLGRVGRATRKPPHKRKRVGGS